MHIDSSTPTFECLYCKATQEGTSTTCSFCKRDFPWKAALDDLRSEVISRETSRLRATTTLVEAVVDANRNNKPISLAAIKGFVTAWLFPRTIIVVGSIVGGVLLGVQTYILSSQTRMLAQQAEAALVEQTAKLRDRIGNRASLLRSANAISSPFTFIAPRHGCVGECARISLTDAVIRAKESPVSGDAFRRLQLAALSLRISLMHLTSTPQQSFSDPRIDPTRDILKLEEAFSEVDSKMSAKELGDAIYKVRVEIVEPILTQCLASEIQAEKYINIINLMDGLQREIRSQTGKKFPLSFDFSLSSLKSFAGRPKPPTITFHPEKFRETPSKLADSYLMGEFLNDLQSIDNEFSSSWQGFSQPCREANERDLIILRRLESNLIRDSESPPKRRESE